MFVDVLFGNVLRLGKFEEMKIMKTAPFQTHHRRESRPFRQRRTAADFSHQRRESLRMRSNGIDPSSGCQEE